MDRKVVKSRKLIGQDVGRNMNIMSMKQVVYTVRGIFRFIIYRENDTVMAHCLETDTVATGDSLPDAVINLQQSITLEIARAAHAGDFSTLWNPAPGEYLAQLGKGVPLIQAVHLGMYPGLKKEGQAEQIDSRLDSIAAKLQEALTTK